MLDFWMGNDTFEKSSNLRASELSLVKLKAITFRFDDWDNNTIRFIDFWRVKSVTTNSKFDASGAWGRGL